MCLVEQNIKISDEALVNLIAETTEQMSKIKSYLKNNWPNTINKISPELKLY